MDTRWTTNPPPEDRSTAVSVPAPLTADSFPGYLAAKSQGSSLAQSDPIRSDAFVVRSPHSPHSPHSLELQRLDRGQLSPHADSARVLSDERVSDEDEDGSVWVAAFD